MTCSHFRKVRYVKTQLQQHRQGDLMNHMGIFFPQGWLVKFRRKKAVVDNMHANLSPTSSLRIA